MNSITRNYWTVTVSEAIAKLTVSAALIVFAKSSGHRRSADSQPYSQSARNQCVTVPQVPEGVGKFTAALLEVCPPVPLEAVVLPAD